MRIKLKFVGVDNFQIHQFDIRMDSLMEEDLELLLEYSFLKSLDRIQCCILMEKELRLMLNQMEMIQLLLLWYLMVEMIQMILEQ